METQSGHSQSVSHWVGGRSGGDLAAWPPSRGLIATSAWLTQIMSLAHSPTEDWLLLGLANGQHCLFNSRKRDQVLTVDTKDNTILGLKFSPNGKESTEPGHGGTRL